MKEFFIQVESVLSTKTFYVPFFYEEHDLVDLSGTCFSKAKTLINVNEISFVLDVSGIDKKVEDVLTSEISGEEDADVGSGVEKDFFYVKKSVIGIKESDEEEKKLGEDLEEELEEDSEEELEEFQDDEDVYDDWIKKVADDILPDVKKKDFYTFISSKNDFLTHFDNINTFVFLSKLRHCVVDKFSYFEKIFSDSNFKRRFPYFFKANVYLVGEDIFYRKLENILSSVNDENFIKLKAYFNLNKIYSLVPIVNYYKNLFWVSICSDEVVLLIESSSLSRMMKKLVLDISANRKSRR